ncbi:atpase aaa : AAA ATPase central domain protein OS=Pedosphaera parvula (strain Ellin514) GN=Cflav_PD3365 PE=4 SV=1: RuvB_N: MgsA_C [Gemmata massiliana]|uniref:Replication-associated recombination protein A n=1 Tax=Gemmata massiliana TaxID=1210884 RepID=A0A6P2D0S6_9BACT|nr:replication-associated recombination protein A [Gemmata massiliana]VTR94723.1 atpase aaa : AAA ATPase central domain protein OS=Pedosphaera parvula (strain Ellin514) GN=Cflav_PD3365 PE=4 SV=1: RuvB_N: MgsA_C [Gemmata massiliana]
MDLFDDLRQENRSKARPLAARMRPRTLDEYVGQGHFLGPGKLLRRMLLADRLNSLIFYGPPGCGKTALAHVIANHTKSRFKPLNAVAAGIKEVRELLAEARSHLEELGERTILFLDEMHRFNRAQQDVLLPDVEDGVIILIGATTQNPFFAINTPLLSRSQIFRFEPLTRDDIRTLISRALADKERGQGKQNVTITEDAMAFLVETCDGDARRALTALEIGVKSALAPENAKPTPPAPLPKGKGEQARETSVGAASISDGSNSPFPSGRGAGGVGSSPGILFDITLAQDSIQQKVIEFDPTGDTHYDTASAFIKSLRGSDPDAALYWMARMLEGGEDPRFVARRLVIFASEDVGNADPFGVVLANAAWDAVEKVGLPECRINLAHAVCYLATALKSNASYMAGEAAAKDVKEGRTLPVPLHLRDKGYRGAKETFGHGVGYKYAHDFEGGWVDQEYIPTDAEYYHPTDRGHEGKIKARLEELRKRKKKPGDERPA